MKKVAILQSNYIPWKGYFDMINMVDEFVLYDDVQYTHSDWRNRNKIKTPKGPAWLTIAIGRHYNKIIDTNVSNPGWGLSHWATLKQTYCKSPYFKEYKGIFEEFYLNTAEKSLSQINYQLISIINSLLGITTTLSWSTEYNLVQGKTARLVDLVEQLGGTHYLSGPAAKEYLDLSLFANANIEVEWMDYSDYPQYNQLHPNFEHGVTILDLIFNEGPDCTRYMKSFGSKDAVAIKPHPGQSISM